MSAQKSDDGTALYNTLLSRRQHIESIFWSRIVTLHAIQAAVLGGGYALQKAHDPALSVALLVIGLLLTLLLFILAHNDWNDARINDKMMHNLGDSINIRRTAERHCLKSHWILYVVIILFFLVDFAFIFFILGTRYSSAV